MKPARFGSYFYMYIGSLHHDRKLIEKIEDGGLYVLDRKSPYRPKTENDWPLVIERSSRIDDIVDDDVFIEISSSYLDQLRLAWGFSSEHPFLGTYEVLPGHLGLLSTLTTHDFDFDAYQYWINTDGESLEHKNVGSPLIVT